MYLVGKQSKTNKNHGIDRMKYYEVLIILLIFSVDKMYSGEYLISHASFEFTDTDRDRSVGAEIFYPAVGSEDNSAVADGEFPVLVFGHGFLISWDSYKSFWEELVPKGYILCFADTESGISPDHQTFADDLKFVAKQMQTENTRENSIFYNSVLEQTALMGHSMGGGASFIAAENNSEIRALVNFAAAETTPSAIESSKNIQVPTLIFAGENDCVAPPKENQKLMYENIAAECKTYISINGGGHCYFADDSIICSLGEATCSPSPEITREEQQRIMFDFLVRWLDAKLKDDGEAEIEFDKKLKESDEILYFQICEKSGILQREESGYKVFPNPSSSFINIEQKVPVETKYLIFNALGQKVISGSLKQKFISIDISFLQPGIYILKIENELQKIVKY